MYLRPLVFAVILNAQAIAQAAKQKEATISTGRAIANAITAGLSAYLASPPSQIENNPHDLLSAAKSNIGKLSRIFERMPWPIPEYEEVLASIERVGCGNYAQSLLDDILPVILDETRTKLSPLVIAAINAAGKSFTPSIDSLYDEYCASNFEEVIANQFVQASILGFASQVYDKHYQKIKTDLTAKQLLDAQVDFDKVDTNLSRGTAEQITAAAEIIREQHVRSLEQNIAQQVTPASEIFLTPMNELAKITTTRGIAKTLEIVSLEQTAAFIIVLKKLIVNLPETPRKQEAEALLDAVQITIELPIDIQAKLAMINRDLPLAAYIIIDATFPNLSSFFPDKVPEKTLLEMPTFFKTWFPATAEMQLYQTEKNILKKLTEYYEMQREQVSFVVVDFTDNEHIKFSCSSLNQNAQGQFLLELAKGSEIQYKYHNGDKLINQNGSPLSAEDIQSLKDRLDRMHDETGSLFKIKKIDPATTIKAVPFK